ncbi:hypothetical protein GCM10009608_41020 [Pseudonocardia alaniniphila]
MGGPSVSAPETGSREACPVVLDLPSEQTTDVPFRSFEPDRVIEEIGPGESLVALPVAPGVDPGHPGVRHLE